MCNILLHPYLKVTCKLLEEPDIESKSGKQTSSLPQRLIFAIDPNLKIYMI